MSEEQKIKIGVAVIIAQIVLLGTTMGFNASMDRQAGRDGIAAIIQEASK